MKSRIVFTAKELRQIRRINRYFANCNAKDDMVLSLRR